MSRPSALLAYLKALKTRPGIYALYLGCLINPYCLRTAAEFHRSVAADPLLTELRNLWLDAVRAEELRMVA